MTEVRKEKLKEERDKIKHFFSQITTWWVISAFAFLTWSLIGYVEFMSPYETLKDSRTILFAIISVITFLVAIFLIKKQHKKTTVKEILKNGGTWLIVSAYSMAIAMFVGWEEGLQIVEPLVNISVIAGIVGVVKSLVTLGEK